MNPRRIWFAVLAPCWLLSVAGAYQGGFHPGLLSPFERLQPQAYPWSGVALTVAQTLLYTVGAYVIVREGDAERLGIALVAAIGVHALHVFSFLTDAPDYTYIPLRYSLLLAVVFLLASIALFVRSRITRHSRTDTQWPS